MFRIRVIHDSWTTRLGNEGHNDRIIWVAIGIGSNAPSAGRLAPESNSSGITTKGGDVLLYPLDTGGGIRSELKNGQEFGGLLTLISDPTVLHSGLQGPRHLESQTH